MLTSLEASNSPAFPTYFLPLRKQKVWDDRALLITLFALFEYMSLWNCFKNREVDLTEHDTISIILAFGSQPNCYLLSKSSRATPHTHRPSLSISLCVVFLALIAIRNYSSVYVFIFSPLLCHPPPDEPWESRRRDRLCCSPSTLNITWHGLSTPYVCVERNWVQRYPYCRGTWVCSGTAFQSPLRKAGGGGCSEEFLPILEYFTGFGEKKK